MRECSGFDRTFLLTDSLYMGVSKVIYSVQHGDNTVDVGMIKLLQLSVKEETSIYEKKWIKGMACMLNFLPRKAVDDTQLGESELWSTYFNPLLTAILSRAEDNLLLKWTNKAAEDFGCRRPDAIITSSSGNNNGCLAYGECKLGGVSKKASNTDIIKLGMFTQRIINIDNKQNVFSFHIEGFTITFFSTSLENEKVYVMKKVGEVKFPRSIDNLPSFMNMKTVNDLLQISKYFWEACNTDLTGSQLSWKKEISYEKYYQF